jgi:hypothetical protein
MKKTSGQAGHDPVRPAWTCNQCERPWPCPDAKRHLHTEYTNDITALHAYMAAVLGRYTIDHPNDPGDEVWRRFLGWILTERPP